ncbi:MAG: hypothetical protein IT431_00985 [Phycisphaerales bacterium]|nr:hypothetical protein [Phycisphaerales bacterium]
MPNLPLAEAFRYLLSGFVLLLYLTAYDPCLTQTLITTLGEVGLVGATLAAGAMLYVPYRGLLYNLFGLRAQDWCRRKSLSYRQYLKELHPELSSSQVMQLYILIRQKLLVDETKARIIPAANVHYAYLAGLLAIPFACVAPWPQRCIFVFLILALLPGAFLYDRRFEDEETAFVLLIPKHKIHHMAAKLRPQPRGSAAGSGAHE